MAIRSEESRLGRYIWLLGLVCVACSSPVGPAKPAESQIPGLERLYSLPNLLGTEPGGAVWSPDSSEVAFLWNQNGTNFRDVWWVSAGDSVPQRLTELPRPTAAGKDGSPELIRAQAEIEQHRGAMSLVWSPDGSAVYFSFNDEVSRVDLAGSLETVAGGAAFADCPSPRVDRVSLSKGVGIFGLGS